MSLLIDKIARELGLAPPVVRWQGVGSLPSAFAVTDLAAASLASVGLALAELLERHTEHCPLVQVDRRLASFWFATSLRPQGWQPPPVWDALTGDYMARDGWVRLHTNAPAHRQAALQVLGVPPERAALTGAAARWDAEALEQAVVEAGGCAAKMRSWAEWCTHPQGLAVNLEPLVLRDTLQHPTPGQWKGTVLRPLAGIKVLDLTRILAGPTASRLLAGFGAQVLRLDPPGWDEPAAVAEVTLGKRCARLDLHTAHGRQRFEQLLAEADVLLHGYRADALEKLGYSHERRRHLNPSLVDVSLDAYGWSGPWQHRRGFDSLVQMSTGIVREGMRWQQAEHPVPLPVQALDHATGYLMAAEVIRALARGQASRARFSLARTAKLLIDHGTVPDDLPLPQETPADLAPTMEHTPWGTAQRIKGPLTIGDAHMHWERGACELGSAEPKW